VSALHTDTYTVTDADFYTVADSYTDAVRTDYIHELGRFHHSRDWKRRHYGCPGQSLSVEHNRRWLG
jgi:hypothetical protein